MIAVFVLEVQRMKAFNSDQNKNKLMFAPWKYLTNRSFSFDQTRIEMTGQSKPIIYFKYPKTKKGKQPVRLESFYLQFLLQTPIQKLELREGEG